MSSAAHALPSDTQPLRNLPPLTVLDELHACLRAVGEQALTHVPPAKIEAKILEFVGPLREMPDVEFRAIDALGYALDLALFTPSLMGQTAVDRLMRSGKLITSAKREAALLLRNSVFRLIQITQGLGKDLYEAVDLASGETLVLFDQTMGLREGDSWALRTCFYENAHLSIGPVTPLDPAMLEIAKPFINHGRSLKNPLRCAEALYRHFIRHGDPMAGVNPKAFEEVLFPFDKEDGPIHALAVRWADFDTLPEPSAAEMRLLRGESYLVAVRESLSACCAAHIIKNKGLIAAYERILVVQLETIHRRNSAGIRTSHETLESLAQDVKEAIRDGHIDSSAAPLFEELCRRAKLACGAKTAHKTSRDELDKVLARIQALRSKTVAQGCTEEEALAAAGKVAELLDRYGLSLSELDIKEQSCAGEGIQTDRRRRSAFDDCVGTIADFCDCRCWYETTSSGHIRHIFFGLPADVAGARYLYEKIEEAFETETGHFKRGDLYNSHASSQRRSATSSFQEGLGAGIRSKLDRLKEARTVKTKASGGRDLVPVKQGMIEDEMADLGLNIRSIRTNSSKRILAKAYQSGRVTGEALEWEEKIQ